jgi:tripartite-type tricarboxylate transporter receptor subunit TctC
MFRLLKIAACALPLLACLVPVTVRADAWPTRPVKVIVGFSPGGFTDVLGRLIGQKLQERLGQPVVVENKPGATGTIGADFVAKSKPDGYTILMGHVNSNSIAPSLYPKLPYDVLRDFTPIELVASTPLLLVVHPSVAATDVKSFIARAKSNPNLRFASSGQGSTQHLAAEQFMLATKITMTHIPYKGSGQAIVDLLSGQVELNFESPPNTLQHIAVGKLRALGITSAKRSPLLPDVPTIAESGVPGFEIAQWFGIFGPAGLPKDIAQRLHAEINAIIKTPDVADKIKAQGGEVLALGPAEFAEFLARDTAHWAKLIREADIRIE